MASEGTLSTLDAPIQALNLARDTRGVLPAQIAFGSASALLTTIRVRFPHSAKMNFWLTSIQDTMSNDQDYVNLGLTCADVCQACYQRLEVRPLEELNRPVSNAIRDLTT